VNCGNTAPCGSVEDFTQLLEPSSSLALEYWRRFDSRQSRDGKQLAAGAKTMPPGHEYRISPSRRFSDTPEKRIAVVLEQLRHRASVARFEQQTCCSGFGRSSRGQTDSLVGASKPATQKLDKEAGTSFFVPEFAHRPHAILRRAVWHADGACQGWETRNKVQAHRGGVPQE